MDSHNNNTNENPLGKDLAVSEVAATAVLAGVARVTGAEAQVVSYLSNHIFRRRSPRK